MPCRPPPSARRLDLCLARRLALGVGLPLIGLLPTTAAQAHHPGPGPCRPASRAKTQRAATLMVRSPVRGASVELDGQVLGETPLPLPVAMPPGRYMLRVQRPGFTPFERAVTLRAGRDLVVDAALVAARSVVRIDGEPLGARVLLDGQFIGLVPFAGEVEPGPGLLEVRAAGYEGYADRVSLEPGVEVVRRVLLVPEAGGAPGLGLAEGEVIGAADDEAPFYGRWWFWTGVGAAVATAVVIGVVVSRDEADTAPAHSLPINPMR